MHKFIEAIKSLFATELAATEAAYSGYDPFKDHYEHHHKAGKSYFLDNGGNDFGEPVAEVLNTETPDENTKLVEVGFTWPDPEEPIERPHVRSWDPWVCKPIGFFCTTEDTGPWAALKIRPNHDELQFHGRKSEWTLKETEAYTATVVLRKENGVWLLATAFPGPASVHNDEELMKKLSKVENLDWETAHYDGADTSHVILLSDEEFDAL
jgi:hypothetical protein